MDVLKISASRGFVCLGLWETRKLRWLQMGDLSHICHRVANEGGFLHFCSAISWQEWPRSRIHSLYCFPCPSLLDSCPSLLWQSSEHAGLWPQEGMSEKKNRGGEGEKQHRGRNGYHWPERNSESLLAWKCMQRKHVAQTHSSLWSVSTGRPKSLSYAEIEPHFHATIAQELTVSTHLETYTGLPITPVSWDAPPNCLPILPVL